MSTENTHLGPARIQNALSKGRGVYFIGIGGVMMSSLALLTHKMGYEVRGSDKTRTATTEKLERQGIKVFYKHNTHNIHDFAECTLTVYTVAISPDNPEYLESSLRGIPAVSRADYLGYIMTHYKKRVGIAGMHGKSTCTSMCAEIFMGAGVDPTVLSGADYYSMGGAYRIGQNGREHFIFEACEYMDSFLDFYPTVAVLLNAEMEHVDYFKSMEQIRTSFQKFAEITGKDGVAVANADDAEILRAAQDATASRRCGKVITFAINDSDADFTASNIMISDKGYPEFDLNIEGSSKGRVRLAVTGRHQIYNSLAAAAAAYACGLSVSDIIKGLEAFSGAGRRMEHKGEYNGAVIYDDYAHHPTEISATLDGAACLCRSNGSKYGKLICAFQPHTYSRTAELFEKFKTAFEVADLIILLDIYSAREVNTYNVTSQKLADAIRASGKNAVYAPSMSDAAGIIRSAAAPGDAIVIMGAGDIYHLSKMLTEQ